MILGEHHCSQWNRFHHGHSVLVNLSITDNFASSGRLVGNEPFKTNPENDLDPRLVGYRFVAALDVWQRNKGHLRGCNRPRSTVQFEKEAALSMPLVRLIALLIPYLHCRNGPENRESPNCVRPARRVDSEVPVKSICRRVGVKLAPLEWLAYEQCHFGVTAAPFWRPSSAWRHSTSIWRQFGANLASMNRRANYFLVWRSITAPTPHFSAAFLASVSAMGSRQCVITYERPRNEHSQSDRPRY